MNDIHYVDAAVIGRRLFILPGEVSLSFQTTGEVSRGHTSCQERAAQKQVPCGNALALPVVAAVTSGVEGAGLAEDPAAPALREECAH